MQTIVGTARILSYSIIILSVELIVKAISTPTVSAEISWTRAGVSLCIPTTIKTIHPINIALYLINRDLFSSPKIRLQSKPLFV